MVPLELIIDAYAPADKRETEHRAAFLDLLRTTPEPYSRSQFVPGHVTASCFIVDRAGRLLLHHHRRLNRWLQMGGHLAPGEDPARAALREGEEESGLRDLWLIADAIADLDVHLIPEGRGEPEHRHYDVRYIALTESADSIAADARESNALMWFDLDRAATLMQGEESLRVIQKIRRLF
ncbi:MAG TPA: NUDIX domain-containing protein [Thermoanaerobaculia bacterium]|nr:NUDIX domain-containing protein [Thermoanaerobaculia bacterium]